MLDQGLCPSAATSTQCARARGELFELEGLDKVVVSAGVEAKQRDRTRRFVP